MNSVKTSAFLLCLGLPCTAAWADTREPIPLDEEQADYVRGVMRGFLHSIQGISAALAVEDWKKVVEMARASGSAATTDAPPGTSAAFSARWKQWGPATHGGFDQLAVDADALKDVKHSLGQLGEISRNCVACHAAHRIQVIDPFKDARL
ncbi:MAG: hypothetical protein PHI49_08685 [Halothiobacillaceae bacterium]|nr:hypothetical protein [Halothiobacillaceae bacterium]